MKAYWHIFVIVIFMMSGGIVYASDIPAIQSITNPEQAKAVCDQSCAEHDCAWSGEWKKGEGTKGDTCDCGVARDRHIPGGVIRSEADAARACREICDLNELPWSGKWAHFEGGFDVCACSYISDWCEPKK